MIRTSTMEIRRKVLLVDDDPELLEIYRDTFAELSSQPEVDTATTGTKALAMLESNEYRLLVTDLRMPRMDGLQLLTIARRRWPDLRTVVLTSNADERFRSRVYALGVDLYWSKPSSEQEMGQFVECMDSLIVREDEVGFRGVQSKSLVDLVQLECISQTSTVLRITNGPFTGRIWISNGDVVDAETEEVRGEEAFQRILCWRAGNFEFLPAEPDRPRTIFKPYNALLLETAQAIDESKETPIATDNADTPISPNAAPLNTSSGLNTLMETDGVEFALKLVAETRIDSRGLNNPDLVATWVRQTVNRFRALGESLQAGDLDLITGMGPQQNLTIANKGGTDLCVGWKTELSADELRQRMNKIVTLWAS